MGNTKSKNKSNYKDPKQLSIIESFHLVAHQKQQEINIYNIPENKLSQNKNVKKFLKNF